MHLPKNVLIKVLKRSGILSKIRFSVKININGKKAIIPIINGIGYPNIFLPSGWMQLLINGFCNTDHELIIDVGANIGQTLIAVKTAGNNISYIGFEPNIVCGYYLHELIKVNQYTDCIVENLALSCDMDHVFLEKEDDTDPRGSIIEQLRPCFFSIKEPVLTMEYDALPHTGKVTLVKIDVEGAELEVLTGMRGMISQDRPVIICEVLDSHNKTVHEFIQNRATRVCNLLKSFKYLIIQLETNMLQDRIISYLPIKTVKVRQWTQESERFNDYIFFPEERQNEVQSILDSLVK